MSRILSTGGQVYTPLGRHPPADGCCSGRYASYWNAFLFRFAKVIFLHLSQSFCSPGGGLHLGVCIQGGPHPGEGLHGEVGGGGLGRPPSFGYYIIRSTSERYDSYGNAFLFIFMYMIFSVYETYQSPFCPDTKISAKDKKLL